jgi:hypothetical protein
LGGFADVKAAARRNASPPGSVRLPADGPPTGSALALSLPGTRSTGTPPSRPTAGLAPRGRIAYE